MAEQAAHGRHACDGSVDRQLVLVSLWVKVGSQLEQCCRKRPIPTGAAPFAGPTWVRDKLGYGALPDLRAGVVWGTCVRDGPELHVLLTGLRATPWTPSGAASCQA